MNQFVLLAKSAIEEYIKEGREISPPDDLPERFFEEKAGVFVTIKKDRELRGCIGTFLPTKENIAQEIISNAIAAATRDYRFAPVQEQELPFLEYTIYLLNDPEPVSSLEDLDPKKYGVLVKSEMAGGAVRTGLLLPDLEGVETAEKQVSIACRKAGIHSQDKTSLFRFSVEKFE